MKNELRYDILKYPNKNERLGWNLRLLHDSNHLCRYVVFKDSFIN